MNRYLYWPDNVILEFGKNHSVNGIPRSFGLDKAYQLLSDVAHMPNFGLRRSFHISIRGLESKYGNCGSSPKFGNEQRQTVIDTALSKPNDLGMPFTEWSLPKLKDYIIGNTDIDSCVIG